MPKITVEGSQRLSQRFKGLGEVASGKMLERALVAGALLVQNDAKRKAPWLTGNLRRSIHIGGHDDLNPGGQGAKYTTGMGVPHPEIEKERAAVYVGTDVVYAGPVEFGTAHMSAQPYLRPAYDGQRGAVVAEVGAALSELIKAQL